MISESIAAPKATSRTERYRERERALWDHYGLAPTERFIELASPRVRLRVVEVGSGDPILFIPGTAGVGPSWGALVSQLPGYRSIMLDRPGWGLSDPIDYRKHEFRRVAADVVRGTLDSLGIDRAHVVGASVGSTWALRFAEAEPGRVRSLVLLGAAPLSPELGPPGFFKMLVSPIGWVIVRLPSNAKQLKSILTGLGHGSSLADGRIPDVYLDWRVGFDRLTDSMRNERDMVKTMIGAGGWRPGITMGPEELGKIAAPTLFVYGTADGMGSADLWGRLVGQLPNGRFLVIPDGGHIPWLDDPERIGSAIRAFLGEAA